MKIKKVATLLLTAVMVFTLAACTPKAPTPVEENNTGNNNNIEEPAPAEETATVKLHFVNQDYIVTGDESLDHTIEVEREIELEDRSVEEVILEELKKQPEDEKLTTVLEKITILSVETKENIAYVDLSSENLHGGSMEEILTLKQIVFSLTDLEEVDAVQILVDGNERETLMGHIIIEEPLRRSDIEY